MKQLFTLLILASFLFPSCKTGISNQKTKTGMTTETENSTSNLTLAAVERFNAAFNRHDVEAVMKEMTEDCIFENTNPAPDGARLVGAEAVRAYWTKFFANNPDAVFESEDVFASGDRCVVRWIYRKTKDGKPWHLRGVDVFKVRDGKVAEKLAYVKG
ncbi:MAG: nuclear transport factor 2 family protein [Spirosomataceae bacterium]